MNSAEPIVTEATASPQPEPTRSRIEFLDSMRGIAAVSVVIFHSLVVQPPFWAPSDNPVVRVLRSWPVRLLWSGHEAVIFFFLLSGFVLALPFVRGTPPRYRVFAVKRIVRLYPPFFAAYVVTLLLFQAVSTYHIEGLTSAFNDYWNRPITWPAALGHVLMLTHSNFINGAAWSLVDEMRMSLIFPLLAAVTLRLGAVVTAALAAGLGIWFVQLTAETATGSALQHIASSLFSTGTYLPVFVFGIGLAAHRTRVATAIAAAGHWTRAALWVGAIALIGTVHASPFGVSVGIVTVGLGFALLLALVLGSPHAARVLTAAPFLWLGRTSYSLYLIHSGVLFFLFYALHTVLPLWSISLFVLPSALVCGVLFWRAFEVPAIGWSKRIPARVWKDARSRR